MAHFALRSLLYLAPRSGPNKRAINTKEIESDMICLDLLPFSSVRDRTPSLRTIRRREANGVYISAHSPCTRYPFRCDSQDVALKRLPRSFLRPSTFRLPRKLLCCYAAMTFAANTRRGPRLFLFILFYLFYIFVIHLVINHEFSTISLL